MISETEPVDFTRMNRERHRRLLQAMERHDIDALILCTRPNVLYATGAMSALSDSSYASHTPALTVVTRDGAVPHLFTSCAEGVPRDFPADRVHPPLYPEWEEGVRRMVETLTAVVGPALTGRVGIDDYTPAMLCLLPDLLADATLVDPAPALGEARIVKTRDEIACLKIAQAINDFAMYQVLPAVRPGVRQTDLTGIFLQRIMELGATGNHVDPIWMPTPRQLSEGPLTLYNDLAFPLPTTDRILREGDTLIVDTGLEYWGYVSDFGRTWIASLAPERHTNKLQESYRLWREVCQAVREVCRPGNTGGDIVRAARKAAGGRKTWLNQFYIVHGIGLDSAEMPFIGTTLGENFDESIVLAPGMLAVIEPCIVEDGIGAYRSEETVVITEGAPEAINRFPYTPWED